MKLSSYQLVWLLVLMPYWVWSQCAPASPSCSGCSAFTSSNQNLSSGTWCITTAVSNINIQSGAVVCISAPGSISNSNLAGGTLIYNSGTLNNFNANSGDFRVHGSLSNPVNTNFNGARVIVENGGILNMTDLNLNGNLVVDGGTLNVANLLRINGGGNLCMANMGVINTQYFQNNATNGTTAQSTKGCISVSQPQNGQTNLNSSLTTSSNVLVCLPGTYIPTNLGSATVSTNCSGCSSAMPVTLVNFRAQPLETGVMLEWQTSNELNHRHFIVERSADLLTFQPISGEVVDPFRTQNGNKLYRFTDRGISQGTFYYRLKQVDTDGTVAYSKTLAVSLGDQVPLIQLFPNPVVDQVTVKLDTEETGIVDMELRDLSGKTYISRSIQKAEKTDTETLNLSQLPQGTYLISVRLGNHYVIRKVVKR